MTKLATFFLLLIAALLSAGNRVVNRTGGGGPGPTYLINQNFETPTTGYDNGPETWTNNGGTINPANTSSPLVGGQSCTLDSAWNEIVSPSFAGQTDVWLYLRVKPTTGDGFTGTGGGGNTLAHIKAADDTVLAALSVKNAVADAKEIYLRTEGTDSTVSATTIPGASSDEYHIWIHYVSGDTCSLHMSTTGVKPSSDGSGVMYLTKSGAANTATKVSINTISGAHLKIDRILVSASAIGDNP